MLRLLKSIWTWWRRRRTRRITPEAVQERVRRGASYLDDVDPEWYERIDREALSLDSGRRCVLGQLHGEFRLGLGRSGLISMSSAPRASLSPVAYGFMCVEDVPAVWQARDYELLTAAWRQAVQARMGDSLVPGDGHTEGVPALVSADETPSTPA